MENFTEFVKKDLLSTRPQPTEGLAWLAAIVRTSATLGLEKRSLVLKFESENDEVIRTAIFLLKALYHLPVEATVDRCKSGLRKGQTVFSATLSQGGTKKLLSDIGMMREENGEMVLCDVGIPATLVSVAAARKNYVKGLFVGAGTVTVPLTDGEKHTNGYHLEIHLSQEILATDLIALLAEEGIESKFIQRKELYVVYIKDREMLSNFLAYVGSGDAVMKIQEIIIEREVNNRLNREANFNTSNLDKTLKASAEQIHALEIIDKYLGIENLPEALREVAALRLDNRFATFSEMQEALPEIGKSGLNHRWRKIMAIAKELEEKYGE